MVGSKGRRKSGGSPAAGINSSSPDPPRQYHQRPDGSQGVWRARLKILGQTSFGSGAVRTQGGRAVALTVDDFRKSGFRAGDAVAVLAGPCRLVVGRISPLASAVLRPGGVGLTAASAKCLGCEEGARVRMRRLQDIPIRTLAADSVSLVLEVVPPMRAAQSSPRAYIEDLSSGRQTLLRRALSFSVEGLYAREGDTVTVSFEGISHDFHFERLLPDLPAPVAGYDEGVEEEKEAVKLLAGLSLGAEVSRDSLCRVSDAAATATPTEEDANCEADVGEDTKSKNRGGACAVPQSPMPTCQAKPSATPSSSAAIVDTADNLEKVEALNTPRARLEAFYGKHNPEKLGDVDGILEKYTGRLDTLFAKLEKKYGAVTLRDVTSGGHGLVGESNTAAGPTSFAQEASPPGDREYDVGSRRQSPQRPGHDRYQGAQRGGRGDDDAASATWGSGQTLWFIDAHTSIELRTVDSLADGGSRDVQPDASPRRKRADAESSKTSPRRRGDWSSVGGLSWQIQQLKEAIELPLTSPEVLERFGVRPPRGVLLHGPPGTGKTTLARAAARACRCHVIVVNGSELMSRFVGESEAALRQTFAEASERAPSLIVFDEVDTLCPRRDKANSEAQRRVVSTMLALLDGVDAKAQVVVIACTNRPQALDPALRRPGRLDSELEVGVPDAVGRAEILRVLLRGVSHEMEDTHTDGEHATGVLEVAARTHGFVGADLQLLVKETALLALRRSREDASLRNIPERLPGCAELQQDVAEEDGFSGGSVFGGRASPPTLLPSLTLRDFRAALPLVAPSGLREVAVEVPSVKWRDIGGMEGVKQSLREVVEWPLRHPEAFQRMGMSPPRGVLLYGPPGCSKTLMARALATESGMNFLAVKGPELLSKWLGETERAMQALFKRARAAAPTIIFFDEVDALASRRGGGVSGGASATERVLTQLLTELDGIQPVKRVVVVAATNRPDVVDPALLRPGRLDRLVYVPPPDTASRREILRLSLAKVPAASDVDREELARRTEGFSGAEVVAVCREAAICALEEDRGATEVRQEHLVEALGQMSPQITPAVLASYASFHGKAP